MAHTSIAGTNMPSSVDRGRLPDEFLNAYLICNATDLRWPVRLYSVRPANGEAAAHEERGSAKNAIWRLRENNRAACRGFGFVVDVNAETVAIPADWQIPAANVELDGLVIDFQASLVASTAEPRHRAIVEGILREAIKRHFKDNQSADLGCLWQDFGAFCQMPNYAVDGEFLFCRRFDPVAKLLAGQRWVVECAISTSTLDRRSLADYYRDGDVAELASMLAAKRSNRLNRQNRPTAIRVWRDQSTEHQNQVCVMELFDPESVLAHGTLSRQEQRSLASRPIRCQLYKRGPVDVPLNEVRLVLDTQITQEDHEETIIDPGERYELLKALRDLLDGAEVYGQVLRLADTPISTLDMPGLRIGPPAIRVRDRDRGHVTIAEPGECTASALRQRSRARADRIRSHGFLQSRPIQPLLAAPRSYGSRRAGRMKADLNYIWRNQGVGFTFDHFVYNDVEELARHVEDHQYDAVLAVLPEDSRAGFQPNDTHEQIKRRLSVPSQCIYHNNTVPASWVDKPPKEFREAEPRLAQRIMQRYELCLGSLLVKQHWVPFAPAAAFHYNVHVGIDVGGRHNTTAMVCVGHGFAAPDGDIVFRPEEIPVEVQKAEPIPTDSLLAGLRQPFQFLRAELGDAADFDRTLFFRDGHYFGQDDQWNELDALAKLHAEFLGNGWISENSVWTAVEVLKYAEGWRVLCNEPDGVKNAVVGRCLFPFDDENTGLVCTTGRPYLPQGTACPLKIKIVNVYGRADRTEVVRDLVWEADMCFTKPDMGRRLPWILHVADIGALQTARKYQITGIPA
jgi:hypothetical protein